MRPPLERRNENRAALQQRTWTCHEHASTHLLLFLAGSNCAQGVEEDGNRVPAADCVLVRLLVLLKGSRILCFDYVHPLLVEALYGLVNFSVRRVVVRVAKSLAPMAKVRGDDKKVFRVSQVSGEERAT